GICVVENIAGHARVPDYHAAPNCVYTDPEIAHVGLGEKEAKDKGLEVRVGRFPFAASGRALTLGQSEGFVKVIADAGSGRLLGAHIIGPRATDLIAEATLAIQNGLTLEQLDLTIHAHPTLPESRMEAALAAPGRATHIANRKISTPHPAPAAPTPPAAAHSAVGAAPPHGGEVSSTPHLAPSSPQRGEAKSNNPVVAAVEVSPKTLELSKDNK